MALLVVALRGIRRRARWAVNVGASGVGAKQAHLEFSPSDSAGARLNPQRRRCLLLVGRFVCRTVVA